MFGNPFIQSLITMGLNVILTGAVGYVVWVLKKNRSDMRRTEAKQCALQKGIEILLFGQLSYYHEKYMNRGNISKFEFDRYKDLYDAYHMNGGNGFAKKMWEDINDLPTI